MKLEAPPVSTSQAASAPAAKSRLPLRGWALELARRWNGATYSLFVLHGNVFDLFPVQDDSQVSYLPLKTFLVRRLFPERACLLFYWSALWRQVRIEGTVERVSAAESDQYFHSRPVGSRVGAWATWTRA